MRAIVFLGGRAIAFVVVAVFDHFYILEPFNVNVKQASKIT
jgi:hypothetical protein